VKELKRGDYQRVAIAWAIWRKTSVPQQWVADELNWTTAANVSNQVRKLHGKKRPSLAKPLQEWMKRFDN